MIERTFFVLALAAAGSSAASCGGGNADALKPVVISEAVRYDSEDPAIWINRGNPAESLVFATDKNKDGALYAFDLSGKAVDEKTVRGLARPNNVDIAYSFVLNGQTIDIAVVTERLENRLRVYRLPDMTAIDNGGIPVFEEEEHNAPMGIALYRRPSDGSMYAVVSRKKGPTEGTYLWQYLFEDSGNGYVSARKVREFGTWSGFQEIEAVAVDNELGFVYYSDEGVGIRKYHADPDAPNASGELALFATDGFREDHEGIAVWKTGLDEGYIIVSDQAAGKLRIYDRQAEENSSGRIHRFIAEIRTSATETDGIDVNAFLVTEKFPEGLLVAMSADRTYHFYSLEDIRQRLPKSDP